MSNELDTARPAFDLSGSVHLTSLRLLIPLLAELALAVPAAGILQAQQQADGRWLEVGHWAYPYLERLAGRGFLPALDRLSQPYRRADVARALEALSPDSLRQPVAGWVRLLQSEFAAPSRSSGDRQLGGLVWAGATAATTERLDPLRALDSGGAWPRGGLGGWITTGRLVAETRLRWDSYLRHDPDGRLPHLPWGGITDHTYAALRWATGSVMLGRMARNWAPLGTQGLLLSDNPISYPQVGLDLELGRFALEALTAELDTLGGARRYLAAHRLGYRGRRVGLALTEALLYSAAGSGLSLQVLDPFTLLAFETENPPDEGRASNLVLGLDFWYGPGAWEVSGRLLLDDVDVNPDSQFTRRAPTRYAAGLQAKWHPVSAPFEASVAYERVSSYAYRSYELASSYAHFGRGLGTNFADYDAWTASAALFPPVQGLELAPRFQLLRQGEGDWRVPFPDESVFRASPDLFLGVVERTYRLALAGRYQPRREIWIRWDLGQNWVRNAGHVLNRKASRFAGLGELGIRWEFGPRRF